MSIRHLTLYTFYISQFLLSALLFPTTRLQAAHAREQAVIKKTDTSISLFTRRGMEITFNRVQRDYQPGKVSFYHIWQLGEVYDTRDFIRHHKIVRMGEWETAIKLEAGFVGGRLHGYEQKKQVKMFVDNREIPEHDPIAPSGYRTFQLQQISDLYDYDSDTSVIAQLEKRWEVDQQGTIRFYQKVTWLKASHLLAAYLTMMPVMRTDGDTPITSFAKRDDIPKATDISQAGHKNEAGAGNKSPKTKKVVLWGPVYKVSVRISKSVHLPNSSLWITNAPQYNKIYADYSGDYTTNEGEAFEIHAVLTLSKSI